MEFLNTGADGIRDIAGNLLASNVAQTFAVAVPSLAKNLFVEAGASSTGATGARANPYPTISAAMAAAVAGDVVAVLPGVYQEQVTMKQFVRLLSADLSSTDTTIFTTSTGSALATIIRAPFVASAPAGVYATITASGLSSFSGLTTEIAGFTIASPLVGDPANGTINPTAYAVDITNSNIALDKDYVIDAGVGVLVATTGTAAQTPSIFNDGIIGNIDGVIIADAGSTPSSTTPVNLINNTFAFNTIGLALSNTRNDPNAGQCRQQHLLGEPRPDQRTHRLCHPLLEPEQGHSREQHVLRQRGQRIQPIAGHQRPGQRLRPRSAGDDRRGRGRQPAATL